MHRASRQQPRAFVERTLSTVILVLVLAPWVDARQAPSRDIDVLMEKVLMRRKVNQEVLQDYVLNDVEQFGAIGPGEYTLFHEKKEYVWYVRDGIHVRSPVRKDGLTIGRNERKEYEDKWIKKEQERIKKKETNAANQSSAPASTEQSIPDPSRPSFMTQIAEPRFISEAYFLDFKFESGHYYFVGRENFDGRDVLVIEYYPSKLFSDDGEKSEASDQKSDKQPEKQRSKKERETDARLNRQMNKTSLITLCHPLTARIAAAGLRSLEISAGLAASSWTTRHARSIKNSLKWEGSMEMKLQRTLVCPVLERFSNRSNPVSATVCYGLKL